LQSAQLLRYRRRRISSTLRKRILSLNPLAVAFFETESLS
jgi:hypothetical protein